MSDEEVDILEEASSEDEIEQINILPHQVEHYKKILSILEQEAGYLDVSVFGSGKSIITLAIAITLKMSILLFAPKSVIPQWKRHAKKYGVRIYQSMTYNSLRGTEKGGTNHELLTRKKDEFTATPTFEKYAKRGMLIVYDECHYLKNDNSQLHAAAALSKEAVRLSRMGYNVRIAALSATPADKKENITSLFKILGIILEPNLYRYNRSNKTYILEGLQEAINKCNRYDKDNTFHIICRQVNKTTSKLICHELYTRVLKNIITSSMPRPENGRVKDIKNLYAIMPDEDVERMKAGALLFASATSYRPETGSVDYKSTNWGKVTESRREIDSAKVNSFVRLAKECLERDPNCKVILYYSFKRDMYRTRDLLIKYNPLVMNGDVTRDEDRVNMMDRFQRHDNKYRVFISNPKVGGAGISLDDTHGGFQRFMFIAPSYNFIEEYQSTGRPDRMTSKSDAVIRFVYSKAFPHESSILNSMIEKSRVARDLIQSNQQGIILPGELENITEKSDSEDSDE